jgi:hypothetical protein
MAERAGFPLASGGRAPAKALAGGLAVAAVLACPIGQAVALESRFTKSPPSIDGTIGAAEWAGCAGTFDLPHGTIYFENDASHLFLLYDMTGDPTLDSPNVDSHLIGFDVNRNGIGDPGIDVEYSTCGDGRLSVRAFLQPAATCGWTGCATTAAVVARGWGPSPASAADHVIFEVAIAFSEIQAQAGQTLRVYLGYYSTTPFIFERTPEDECAYAEYLPLHLGPRTVQLRRHIEPTESPLRGGLN